MRFGVFISKLKSSGGYMGDIPGPAATPEDTGPKASKTKKSCFGILISNSTKNPI